MEAKTRIGSFLLPKFVVWCGIEPPWCGVFQPKQHPFFDVFPIRCLLYLLTQDWPPGRRPASREPASSTPGQALSSRPLKHEFIGRFNLLTIIQEDHKNLGKVPSMALEYEFFLMILSTFYGIVIVKHLSAKLQLFSEWREPLKLCLIKYLKSSFFNRKKLNS